MKKEFFEYIGAPDSLKGYARSYKLVFFKCFFNLMDKNGAVNADDLVREFKKFYVERASNGKLVDANVDSRMENINESADSEIYKVIIQNPYKHIHEHGFVFKSSHISGNTVFRLSGALLSELTSKDIEKIQKIINSKIKLYFLNIDNGVRTNTSVQKLIKESQIIGHQRKKSEMQRLIDRIDREFDKYKYIGDIQIDDEDYERLIKLFANIYERICDSVSHMAASKVLAVALVQIGIHEYNGSFWNHVSMMLQLIYRTIEKTEIIHLLILMISTMSLTNHRIYSKKKVL